METPALCAPPGLRFPSASEQPDPLSGLGGGVLSPLMTAPGPHQPLSSIWALPGRKPSITVPHHQKLLEDYQQVSGEVALSGLSSDSDPGLNHSPARSTAQLLCGTV